MSLISLCIREVNVCPYHLYICTHYPGQTGSIYCIGICHWVWLNIEEHCRIIEIREIVIPQDAVKSPEPSVSFSWSPSSADWHPLLHDDGICLSASWQWKWSTRLLSVIMYLRSMTCLLMWKDCGIEPNIKLITKVSANRWEHSNCRVRIFIKSGSRMKACFNSNLHLNPHLLYVQFWGRLDIFIIGSLYIMVTYN